VTIGTGWFGVETGASGYAVGMTVTNALASLAVRDLEASTQWYEVLLGKGSHPMTEVVEWKLERGGGLQVYEAPDRAGRGSCTLIVSDIDELAERLHQSGLAADAEPTRNDRVDTIMIKDPDGNSLAFSMPKDEQLVR
jgi:glyoxalase/bleomycin resistance protein/dioxygenase superfamily protein